MMEMWLSRFATFAARARHGMSKKMAARNSICTACIHVSCARGLSKTMPPRLRSMLSKRTITLHQYTAGVHFMNRNFHRFWKLVSMNRLGATQTMWPKRMSAPTQYTSTAAMPMPSIEFQTLSQHMMLGSLTSVRFELGFSWHLKRSREVLAMPVKQEYITEKRTLTSLSASMATSFATNRATWCDPRYAMMPAKKKTTGVRFLMTRLCSKP
mmetsp:Transcript_69217/g.202683  ORF Transcript_69217/g.202683 Transcript_69217/m.202683 type:complete len:212 (-) Transcript_69217:606-1241(-)